MSSLRRTWAPGSRAGATTLRANRCRVAAQRVLWWAHVLRQAGHPEVSGAQGQRSVAIAYAWMESQVAGRSVTVDEVLNDELNAYQADINDSLGI